jgi:hypothetical protein
MSRYCESQKKAILKYRSNNLDKIRAYERQRYREMKEVKLKEMGLPSDYRKPYTRSKRYVRKFPTIKQAFSEMCKIEVN